MNYDKNSADSIYEYSKKLTGKSLVEVAMLEGFLEDLADKGSLGSLIEKHYFNHTPPNTHEPDFPEAGIELKTTGLKITSKGLRAKERLVITMINYNNIVKEDWETSVLWKKLKKTLILFYLYDKSKTPINRKFVRDPILFVPTEEDVKIIQQDWHSIKEKIRSGKAHELSEGDTFYLGACRKGAGGDEEALRTTPGDAPSAKSRAFSLKPSFINMLLDREQDFSSSQIKKGLLTMTDADSIEVALEKALEKFIGKSVTEIADFFHVPIDKRSAKSFNFDLVTKMLSADQSGVPEFRKAGIELKTIRREPGGHIKESMSFPSFEFIKIVDEDWEDSAFAEKLEKKFLFVLYQKDLSDKQAEEKGIHKNDNLRLVGAKFWNMPFSDRMEAKKVFEETKRRVMTNPLNLPSSKENPVSHVRPKASNKNDTYPLPQGGQHTKQCFWLNNYYIKNIVNELFGGVEDLPFS